MNIYLCIKKAKFHLLLNPAVEFLVKIMPELTAFFFDTHKLILSK